MKSTYSGTDVLSTFGETPHPTLSEVRPKAFVRALWQQKQNQDFYGTCKAIDMLRRLIEVKAEAQDSQLAAHATRT
jgi:hypothetical protein